MEGVGGTTVAATATATLPTTQVAAPSSPHSSTVAGARYPITSTSTSSVNTNITNTGTVSTTTTVSSSSSSCSGAGASNSPLTVAAGAPTTQALEMGIKNMEVVDDWVIQTVEIIKRPGQTLGFYIREGNGMDRQDGVFISRIQMGTVAESNGLLHVGDEILTVNNVKVLNMSLDDVVILMSIPKKLILTIRTRKNHNKNASCPSLAMTEREEPPVVVLKKGRSSSATALEMTEKCADAFEQMERNYLSQTGAGGGAGGGIGVGVGMPPPMGPMPPELGGGAPGSGGGGSGSSTTISTPITATSSAEGLKQKDGAQERPSTSASTSSSSVAGNASTGTVASSTSSSTATPASSRYASIYISPHKAEAKLCFDDVDDSGNSSDNSLPRSTDSGSKEAPPYSSHYGVHGAEGIYENPTSFLSPSLPSIATSQQQLDGSGDESGSGGAGTSPHRKFPSPSGSWSPSKGPPFRPHPPPRGPYSSSDGETNKGIGAGTPLPPPPFVPHMEVPYANLPGRDFLAPRGSPVGPGSVVGGPGGPGGGGGVPPGGIPGGFHDDRWSQERLRDMLHTKAKYGRMPSSRSRSPECYSSDSEVIYAHPHPRVDPRGFASDYETYAGVTSDDEIYSIPHISASSSTELQLLLKKFNTLSQELQQEQNRLQKQIFARSKAGQGPMSGSRSSVTTPDSCPSDDYYDWTWAAVKGSPGPTRRAAATQTPQRSQMVRKHSTDSLLAYRTYQMDDPLAVAAAAAGQKGGSTLPSVVKSGKPVCTAGASSTLGSPVDRAKRFDASGRAVTRPASRFRDLQLYKKPLQIHYGDYESYRSDMKKKVEVQKVTGLDGMLGIHVLSGQGLKSSRTTLRDLYCVVAVDSINKARTMIRTGAVNFDWDEAFDVELEDAKEVSFLIYNWDPNFKHRLCFHGSIVLPNYIVSGETKHIALKVEPRGVLYVELLYKKPAVSLQRLPSTKKSALFGTDLEVVIKRENSGSNVPLIVKKCIEEIENRGLEVVGIYRLCGSARRKTQLRELFEKNSLDVNLSVEFVTDIHTITGVLKDYLRELPEPLFTNVLYQMLLDALTVRLPGDPDGGAKLMLSILECLPKANQDTMTLVLNHLKRVASKSDLNKMTVDNLAVCFGPVLLCPSPSTSADLDFKKHIEVLKYLLEIWPDDFTCTTSPKTPPQSESKTSLKPATSDEPADEGEPKEPTESQGEDPNC